MTSPRGALIDLCMLRLALQCECSARRRLAAGVVKTDLHFHFLVVELRLLLAHHQSGAMTLPTIRLSFLKNLLGLNVKHAQLDLVPAASQDSETAGRLPHPAS